MKVIKESKTIPYGDVKNPVMLNGSQIKKYETIPFKQNSTFQDAQAQLENIRKEFPDAKAGINNDRYKNVSTQNIYPKDCFIFYKKSKNESYWGKNMKVIKEGIDIRKGNKVKLKSIKNTSQTIPDDEIDNLKSLKGKVGKVIKSFRSSNSGDVFVEVDFDGDAWNINKKDLTLVETEGIENLDRVNDLQPVENPVMADAQQEADKKDKETKKLTDPMELKNNKAFLGASKQPVPKDAKVPNEATAKMYSLDESLFEDLDFDDYSDFKSDIYNAVADIMFKYRNKGVSEKDVDWAFEWFLTHFFEFDWDEDNANESLKESVDQSIISKLKDYTNKAELFNKERLTLLKELENAFTNEELNRLPDQADTEEEYYNIATAVNSFIDAKRNLNSSYGMQYIINNESLKEDLVYNESPIAERFMLPWHDDYELDTVRERDAIAKEFGIDKKTANNIMINELGFEPEQILWSELNSRIPQAKLNKGMVRILFNEVPTDDWNKAVNRCADTFKVSLDESIKEAKENPNFDSEKYGKYFDENGKIIPELFSEWEDLYCKEAGALDEADYGNKGNKDWQSLKNKQSKEDKEQENSLYSRVDRELTAHTSNYLIKAPKNSRYKRVGIGNKGLEVYTPDKESLAFAKQVADYFGLEFEIKETPGNAGTATAYTGVVVIPDNLVDETPEETAARLNK